MDKKRHFTIRHNYVMPPRPPRRRKPKYPLDAEIARRVIEDMRHNRFQSYRAAIKACLGNDLDRDVDLETIIRRIKRLVNSLLDNKSFDI
jgi:hypothetical protein